MSSAVESRGGLLAPEILARVKQVHLRTHRLVNTALAGSYRSTFRGTGIEFEEVRPYVPGDDVRAIDWKVSARAGDTYVKTYREERELTVHLLVDTALPMDFGTQRWTKREAAAQLAGLVAMVALRNQDRVGLALFGPQPGLHLPAGKGSRKVLRLIREVITAPASDGPSDLGAMLEATERVLRRRSLVFLVSDFLSGLEEEDDWTEPLARLARRHDVIAVRVVDPLEEELPPAGLVTFTPITGGPPLEADAASRRVRAAWAEAAERRRAAIGSRLARARVERFDLRTERDLAEPLVAFFRRREMARRRAP